MDTRYSHPDVTELWSAEWTYDTWLRILTYTLHHQSRHKVVDADETKEMLRALRSNQVHINVGEIQLIEEETKHDVVAFLRWLREDAISDPASRWLHYGLTSSDLVDTTMGIRFNHMHRVLTGRMLRLASALTGWTLDESPILARTHGQPAEPMFMRARATHWLTNMSIAGSRLIQDTKAMKVAKLSGPVGTYAHSPVDVEVDVALDLGLDPAGAGCSQIIPRGTLAAWANSASELAAALAKVATDIRLMNLLGEVQEPFGDGQVGSSSMAHKKNPIKAERICGMARMARGYAAMLIDQDLWLERDISNSSVERVAVPDLWHTILFMMKETVDLLTGMKLDEVTALRNLEDAGNAPMVSSLTLDHIRAGMDVETSRRYALDTPATASAATAAYFMRNYPEDTRERH